MVEGFVVQVLVLPEIRGEDQVQIDARRWPRWEDTMPPWRRGSGDRLLKIGVRRRLRLRLRIVDLDDLLLRLRFW